MVSSTSTREEFDSWVESDLGSMTRSASSFSSTVQVTSFGELTFSQKYELLFYIYGDGFYVSDICLVLFFWFEGFVGSFVFRIVDSLDR